MKAPTIALIGELSLPDDVLATCRVITLTDEPKAVEADIILVEKGEFSAWSRANQQVPVFVLSGNNLLAMSLLGGRLVPQLISQCDDLKAFIVGVTHATNQLSHGKLPARRRPYFTKREREVFEGLVQGYNLAEIAEELGITENTVKNYLTNARYKLGARDRTLAVLAAIQHGLIDWPPLP